MEFTLKERKKINAFVKSKAYQYYRIYKHDFLENCIEFRDLTQELHLRVLEYIKDLDSKNKTKDDFWKLIHNKLDFECKHLRRDTLKSNENCEKSDADITHKNSLKRENKKVRVQPVTFEVLLEEHLGERDARIFLKRVIDKYTLEEIAREYKISRQAIHQIIKESIAVLKNDKAFSRELRSLLVQGTEDAGS